MTRGSPRRRATAIALLSVVPWTIVTVGPVVTLLFPAALVTYSPGVDAPPSLLPVWAFVDRGGRLPRTPELLPLTAVMFHLALAGAIARVGSARIPDRAVAGVLVLAGVLGLGVPLAFAHRLRYLALPVGSLLALTVAWWYYAAELYSLTVPAARRSDE